MKRLSRKKKKKKLLVFDNCLIGDCNMNCLYCRDNKTTMVRSDLNKQLASLRRISFLASKHFDIPILKISGYGEIFILSGVTEMLKKLSENYETIQVITNATLLNKNIISELSKIKGINVCVSLDGHIPELNYCRTGNGKIISKVLNNIENLRSYGIPVEINSVLTKYNISGFVDFVDYLANRYDQLVCYPFPVRGFPALSVFGRKNAERILPLLHSYKRLSHILPPKEYLKRLISFISEGGRKHKCFVGYGNLGLDPSGDILVCACSIKQSVANIFDQEMKPALKIRESHPVFYKFLFKELSFKSCAECFTHYEVINLYLDGTIPLKEIRRVPLFSGERTEKIMKELRSQLA